MAKKTYKIPGYKSPAGVATINREMYEKAKLEERNLGLLVGLATACVTLRGGSDPYGPKRMKDFLHRFAVQIDCMAEHYATADDMIEILVDEVGIDIADPTIRRAFPGLAKIQKEANKEKKKHD